MFTPYLLMTFLYITLAVLGALDASLVNFQFLPMFAGLRWMRVHFITLGAMTEIIFGLLPIIAAARLKLPHPRVRWDIWLTLNLGLLVLLLGIPMINSVMITVGGVLIFAASILLILQLRQIQPEQKAAHASAGRRFYITGLIYLLLGITVGTGLWQGWSAWLQIQVPIEVHIHANNWGFMSLIFAGLLVDLYPSFSGHVFQWKHSITPIFWMMTFGALGLVLGPWFKSNLFSVPGLILHLSATIWLLLNVIKPLMDDRRSWSAGMFHLVTSYLWILAPVLIAPLIILGVPGFPGAGIEQNAPQALIYGWVLQFGYAIIPLLFRRTFSPQVPARLGGNWFSLITVHLGGVLLWLGIFVQDAQAVLHGTAYGLWFVSMLPIAYELWKIVRVSFENTTSAEFEPLVMDGKTAN